MSKDEINEFLNQNYMQMTHYEMGLELNLNKQQVCYLLRKLGLFKSKKCVFLVQS